MARPSKFTAETQKKILDAIQMGATYQLAAGYAGIAYETLREWMHTKPAFSAAIKEAEGRGAMVWLAKIEKAASEGNWQAAAWKLERRYPNDYGRQITQHEGEQSLTVRFVNDWRGDGGVAAGANSGDSEQGAGH